jgi:hypothetical protein
MCMFMYVLCVLCIVFVQFGLIYVSDSCWEIDIAQISPDQFDTRERKVSQSVPEHVVYTALHIYVIHTAQETTSYLTTMHPHPMSP